MHVTALIVAAILSGSVVLNRYPIPGAVVIVVTPRGLRTSVTDPRGAYQFLGLQEGSYCVEAQFDGLTGDQTDVVVGAADRQDVVLALTEPPSNTITVTATAWPTHGEAKTNITKEMIDSIPLVGTKIYLCLPEQ